MALTSTLTNIKIANNTVDIGKLSTGTYAYASAATIGGSAFVSNNTFSGTIGNGAPSTNIMLISQGSCSITNNVFIRGTGSPINSYITNNSTDDQIITDNIFDGYTVDGTSEELVVGLTNASLYERNKNQTKYIPVALLNGVTPSLTANGSNRYGEVSSASEATHVTSVSGVPGGVNWFTQAGGSGLGAVTRRITFRADLTSYMPENIKLIDAKMGFYTVDSGSIVLASGNQLVLTVDTQDMEIANYAAGANSLLDQKELISGSGNPSPTTVSTTLDINTNYSASKSNTQYLTLDFVANPLDIRNTLIDFRANLTVSLTSISAFGIMSFYISPLILRCRW